MPVSRPKTTQAADDRDAAGPRRHLSPLHLLRRLLCFSAELAERRGGGIDPHALGFDSTVDARTQEAWLDIDGAQLFVGNVQWPVRWSGLGRQRHRLAQAVEAPDGSFRLTVYERSDGRWCTWEGPSVVADLAAATALGQRLLSC